VLGRIWRIDWVLMRRLIVIGAPISVSFLMEYGLFGCRGAFDGPDQHHGAGGAPDRTPDCGYPCSWCPSGLGWQRRCASDTPSEAAMRRRRSVPGWSRLASALSLCQGDDARRTSSGGCDWAILLRRSPAESAGVVIELTAALLMVGATILCCRRHPDRCGGRAARHE